MSKDLELMSKMEMNSRFRGNDEGGMEIGAGIKE